MSIGSIANNLRGYDSHLSSLVLFTLALVWLPGLWRLVPAHAAAVAADPASLWLSQCLLCPDPSATGGCPQCCSHWRSTAALVGTGIADAAEKETGRKLSTRIGAVNQFFYFFASQRLACSGFQGGTWIEDGRMQGRNFLLIYFGTCEFMPLYEGLRVSLGKTIRSLTNAEYKGISDIRYMFMYKV